MAVPEKQKNSKNFRNKLATYSLIAAGVAASMTACGNSSQPKNDNNNIIESEFSSSNGLKETENEDFSTLMQTLDYGEKWDWKNYYSEAQLSAWKNEILEWAPNILNEEQISFLERDYPYFQSLTSADIDSTCIDLDKGDYITTDGKTIDICDYKYELIKLFVTAYWEHYNTFGNTSPSTMWNGLVSSKQNPYYNLLKNGNSYGLSINGPIEHLSDLNYVEADLIEGIVLAPTMEDLNRIADTVVAVTKAMGTNNQHKTVRTTEESETEIGQE